MSEHQQAIIRTGGKQYRVSPGSVLAPTEAASVRWTAAAAGALTAGPPPAALSAAGLTSATGAGFMGIAVALLGRNSAPGMAVAALLFGFLDSSAAVLQVSALASSEIVVIMQATVLLVAVIAYEVVNRIRQRDEIRRAAQMVGVTS